MNKTRKEEAVSKSLKSMMMPVLAATSLMMSGVSLAELNEKKLELYKDSLGISKVYSHKKIKDGLYEVFYLGENNRLKVSSFYTDENINFVTPILSLVNENGLYMPKNTNEPTISESDKKSFINENVAVTIGTGEEKYHFIDIMSPEGYISVFNMLSGVDGEGYENRIIFYFNVAPKKGTETYVEDSRILAEYSTLYMGDKKERRETLESIVSYFNSAVKAVNQEVVLQELSEFLMNKFDNMGDRSIEAREGYKSFLNNSRELTSILYKGRLIDGEYPGHFEFDKNLKMKKIEVKEKPEKLSQKVNTDYDFTKIYGADLQERLDFYKTDSQNVYDFNGTNIDKLIEDVTAYKIGSGEYKVILFTDINCPACNKFDKEISLGLKKGVEVSVIYMPNKAGSLDKTRHVLSVSEEDRDALNSMIQGSLSTEEESQRELSKVKYEDLYEINERISKAFTFAMDMRVNKTPTLMVQKNGKITRITNIKSIIKIK